MKRVCQICGSDKIHNFKFIVKNRYTEEFSKILKLSIKQLEQKFSNLICRNCFFIFKKKWFTKNFLKNIYSRKISSHPRGWDTISNKFTKKYLFEQFDILEKKIKNHANEFFLNHIKRNILGITTSMKLNYTQKKFIDRLNKSIEENDLEEIKSLKKKNLFNFEAKEFSRYNGFKSVKLFDYLTTKIGKINYYGEIGCPLWGMLDIAKSKNCFTYFIKPEPEVFWGANCKNGKYKCIEKIKNTAIISKIDKFSKNFLDFLGVFNLIDHHNNPISFLKKNFKYSKSIGIITEKNAQGIPIQHHNILSKKSIKKIGMLLDKKVDFGYNKFIKNSQYNFYLFY